MIQKYSSITGIQLCTRYGLSETDIVDTWMAFTVSNNEDLQVTVEALSLMEKKELAKKSGAKVSSSFGKSPIIENLSADLYPFFIRLVL